jgi:S1-C subfamily serine protease
MAFSKQTAALAIVLLGTGAGAVTYYWFKPSSPDSTDRSKSKPSASSSSTAVADRSTPGTDNLLDFVSQVVTSVGPAVVRIEVKEAEHSSSLEEFGKSGESHGSGFISTADGQIITNAHVVGTAKQVQVTLRDGRVLTGKVVGSDRLTDVALVQVSGQNNLPTVKINATDQLIPGQWAIAIGSPLDLDNSVTLGIVSAINRSSSQVGIPDVRSTFIQADVAINPGNSGGPLLNARGEAIGINTAINKDGQGLSFAIPVKTAQRITQQLLATGRAVHPYLGVQMNPNKDEDPQKTGVVLTEVMPNTPAAKGGLQAGDRILKIGGVAIKSPDDLQEQVDASSIDQPLAVEIERQGQIQTLSLRPAAYPTNSVKS